MEFKAKDVMNSPAITVHEDDSLKDVINLFAEYDISGAPVVNDNLKLVGIITERDIINFSNKTHVVSLINTSAWVSPHTDINELTKCRKGFELISSTKVKNQMSKKVYSVKEDTPGAQVAAIMKRRSVERIPVVDENDQVRGIITRTDLVNKIAEL